MRGGPDAGASGGPDGPTTGPLPQSWASSRLRLSWCAPTTAVLPHTSYAAKSSRTSPTVISSSPVPRMVVRTTVPSVVRVRSECTLRYPSSVRTGRSGTIRTPFGASGASGAGSPGEGSAGGGSSAAGAVIRGMIAVASPTAGMRGRSVVAISSWSTAACRGLCGGRGERLAEPVGVADRRDHERGRVHPAVQQQRVPHAAYRAGGDDPYPHDRHRLAATGPQRVDDGLDVLLVDHDILGPGAGRQAAVGTPWGVVEPHGQPWTVHRHQPGGTLSGFGAGALVGDPSVRARQVVGLLFDVVA